jgi:hypothetical protein
MVKSSEKCSAQILSVWCKYVLTSEYILMEIYFYVPTLEDTHTKS